MWGEFEDERRDQPTSTTRKTLPKSDEALPSEDLNQVDVPDESLSLKDRIIHHLAASKVVLKSQQRYEPDFTYEERRNIAETMLDEKPGQFLYRCVFTDHLRNVYKVISEIYIYLCLLSL